MTIGVKIAVLPCLARDRVGISRASGAPFQGAKVVGICLLLSQVAWSGIVGEIKIGPDSVKFTFPSTYDSLAKSAKRRKLSYDTLVDDFDRDGKPDRFVRVYSRNSEREYRDREGWALYAGDGGSGLVWSTSYFPYCGYIYRCDYVWKAERGYLFWGASGGVLGGNEHGSRNQYRFQDGEFELIGATRRRFENSQGRWQQDDKITKLDWNLATGRCLKDVRYDINGKGIEVTDRHFEHFLVVACGTESVKNGAAIADAGRSKCTRYRLTDGDSVRVFAVGHGDTVRVGFSGKIDSLVGPKREVRSVRSSVADTGSEFVFVHRSDKYVTYWEGFPYGLDFQAFRGGDGHGFRVLAPQRGGRPILRELDHDDRSSWPK